MVKVFGQVGIGEQQGWRMVSWGTPKQIKETEWRWEVQEAQMVSQMCATENQGADGVAMGTRMDVR